MSAKAFISVVVRNAAKNAAIKQSREKKRIIDFEDDVLSSILVDESAGPLEHLIIAESVAIVKKEILGLPEKYAIVLEMKYILKYDISKIAKLLDLKPKTVYARDERGKAILLKRLNSLEEEKV